MVVKHVDKDHEEREESECPFFIQFAAALCDAKKEKNHTGRNKTLFLPLLWRSRMQGEPSCN